MLRTPKPKTNKGRRVIEKKEPKINENPKKAMFIRGHKTSLIVQDTIKDLYKLKKPDAALFKKHNQILPFEDATSIEFLSQKSDCSLFALGSHSKKRPHNIIMGRTFHFQLLDMVELGIEKYVPISQFKTEKCTLGAKHCFLFNGEVFDQKEEYIQLKNMFLDFYFGDHIQSVNLAGLDHVISLSASQEGKIYFRVYSIRLKKSGGRVPRVELTEMGPSIDFVMRRFKAPAKEVLKEALKIPRTLKPKKVKNISTDMLGKKYGQIHLGKQDLSKMALRKMKGLKRGREEKSNEEGKKNKKSKVDTDSANETE